MKDRMFDIWFSLRVGIANREFPFILEQYESTYQIFTADEAELGRLPCGEGLKRSLGDKDLTEACRIMEYCDKYGVGLLFYQDADYPASLRTLSDPPALLYYQGQLPDFAHLLCISVVGTRKMTEYGKRMAYKIGYELAAANTVVISGMALGNDSVAAVGALRAGGSTVAVLGSGIDITYPPEHTKLRQVIQSTGAVITEYPPATRPEGRNFPVRNRIISGLSQGVVIVEADNRSGALITARTALVQGRHIFAVPGNVGDMNTAGTNQLIRDGAIVALDARDILQNYEFLYSDVLRMGRLPMAEKQSEPDEEALAAWGVCAAVTLQGRGPERPLVRRQKPQDPPARIPRRHRGTAPDTDPVSEKTADDGPAPSEPSNDTASRTPVTDSDRSQTALDSLTDTQRRIFEALPLDHSVTLDELSKEGFTAGEIMAAMTVLEIKGLTVTLPGSLYQRR